MADVKGGLRAVHNVQEWREANKHLFSPPVCNKLMCVITALTFLAALIQ